MGKIEINVGTAGADEEISVVQVAGAIDTVTAREFEQVITTLLSKGRFRLIVDLSGVFYVSSAGWGVLASNLKEARSNEGDIKLVNLAPDVYKVFNLLEIDTLLSAHDTLKEAVTAFDLPTSPA